MIKAVRYADLSILVGNTVHKIKVQEGIRIGNLFAYNGKCYSTSPNNFSNGGTVKQTNQISMSEEEYKLLMNCANNYNEGLGNALSYTDITRAEKLNKKDLNKDSSQGFSNQYSTISEVHRFTDIVQLDTFLYKNNNFMTDLHLSYSLDTNFMNNISNAVSASKDGKVVYDYTEGESYLKYKDKNNKTRTFGNIFGKLQSR